MRNWLLILAILTALAALSLVVGSSDTPCADSACVEEWP